MELTALEKALRESWSAETCSPGSAATWSRENAAKGQCAVTALVVQDYLGGDLLYCTHTNHFWNKVPEYGEVDFTRDQFPSGTAACADEVRPRTRTLEGEGAKKSDMPSRYGTLKERVRKILEAASYKKY